jgi:uncharacterized SAM-binding protein YcdF (DUF218 family)
VPRSLTKDLLRLGFASLLALALTAGYATVRIWQIGDRDERGRPVDAIVVLGAAHYNGQPSPIFRARLDHAVELYLNRVAPYLVVTGGRAPGDTLSEAEVARRYAMQRGVPVERILMEGTGRDTLGSLRNVAGIFEERRWGRGLFVSDRSHMLRVLRIAEDLGIDSFGSPTRSSPLEADRSARLTAVLHELAALSAYFLLGR